VVALANDTEYGLAATVFTGDPGRADAMADGIRAGTVWVNCFFVRDLAAPFGGRGISGIGREGGEWSFDFYCDVKNVSIRRDGFATKDRATDGAVASPRSESHDG
jgi:5-carboxymethyl-2-hydroxymuconic-semialdehyde dehydrogenase